MKLGTETGSLVNHIMTTSSFEIPKVGDGATLCSWSDRNPATVIMVQEKGNVVYIDVQSDDYKRIDDNGMSECQEYEYTANPEGSISHFRIRKGKIERIRKNPETGRWIKSSNGGVYFGKREKFYDYSF